MILCCRAALLLSGLVAAVSCSKERSVGEKIYDPEEPVFFGIDTRDAEPQPNTTFRVLLYETSRDHLFRFHSSATALSGTGRGWGTYYYNNETFNNFPVLTPCKLNDDGTFVETGTVEEYGINGQSQAHYVAYISPGIRHDDTDGTVTVDPSTPFYATGAQKKSLGGYGVVLIDSALVERRARIGFRIFQGEQIGQFTMREVAIRGAGGDGTADNPKTVTYHPCTQQVLENTTRRPIDLTTISSGMEGYDARLRYRSASDEHYVVASIYARKDAVSELLGQWYKEYYTGNFIESDYLYFCCKLKVGDNDEADVLMPLTTKMPVLRPMHSYIFNITVKSQYIDFSVEIYNHQNANAWEDVNSGDGTIGEPDATVYLGSFQYGLNGNGWEDVEDNGQTIE